MSEKDFAYWLNRYNESESLEEKMMPYAIIIKLIQTSTRKDKGEILQAFKLIRKAKITEGHDAIFDAIGEYYNSCENKGMEYETIMQFANECASIKEYLDRQKEQAEFEKFIDPIKGKELLDALQQELFVLNILLTERHLEDKNWQNALCDKLKRLNFI